jgi:hypothetical protein
LKGFSGQQMIRGFHGVEPAMLAAGQTASDVSRSGDRGKADQPLSSLVRIGLPFGGPSVSVGTGKTA